MNAVYNTDFEFQAQTGFYKGKVRDNYYFGDRLAMVASDRISAFDHILPRAIPNKGVILNTIASKCLKATEDIVPNWLESTPNPRVSVGKICKTIPIEMVIRGYLTGHSWRVYNSGGREICGVQLPEGLKENDRFDTPIITPATKAEEGHDEDISREEIIRQNIVEEEVYTKLEDYTRKLFQRGTELAASKGLILVDTKYEFGIADGEIFLIDEIHTPDSSRYFYADTYDELLQKGERQRQLSKEFVREWLMSKGFQGLDGQSMPEMDDATVEMISGRYVELYEKFTGEKFEFAPEAYNLDQIRDSIENAIN